MKADKGHYKKFFPWIGKIAITGIIFQNCNCWILSENVKFLLLLFLY